MLLFTLSQTSLDLLKSETTYRLDREEMGDHAHLCTGSLKEKKWEKPSYFVSNKFLCLSWDMNSPWKIWEENASVIVEILVA